MTGKMKKYKTILISLILAFFIFPFFLPNIAQADPPVEKPEIQLNIPLGGDGVIEWPYFPNYLEKLYRYFVGATAILAAVMLMFGGYKWVFASGNQQMISSAKQTIMNAAVGLILALTSFILLNLLNPRIPELDVGGSLDPPEGQLTLYACSEEYPLTGPDGHCMPASDMPPLKICQLPGEGGGPDEISYGRIEICPYNGGLKGLGCGVSKLNDSCIPVSKDNCFGIFCEDDSKNACFIKDRDMQSNAYMQCDKSVTLVKGTEYGFTDTSYTGSDGTEFPNWLTGGLRFYCGALYTIVDMSSGKHDCYFGTAWGGVSQQQGECLINFEAGYEIVLSKTDCQRSPNCRGYEKCLCPIGYWNQAWYIEEGGEPVWRGQMTNPPNGGGVQPTGVDNPFDGDGPGTVALPEPPETPDLPEICSDWVALAAANNTIYPSTTDSQLEDMINYIKNIVPDAAAIPTYTYDQDFESCNYTRGDPMCSIAGACSHSENSCHYGGNTGQTGALAVDWAINGSIADAIVNAACGWTSLDGLTTVKRNTCEDDSGNAVSCFDLNANHVHQSISTCDRDLPLGCY